MRYNIIIFYWDIAVFVCGNHIKKNITGEMILLFNSIISDKLKIAIHLLIQQKVNWGFKEIDYYTNNT